jgi:DNA-binding NarL/FixJ family response regulator
MQMRSAKFGSSYQSEASPARESRLRVTDPPKSAKDHALTEREEQIVALAARGLSNKAIAWELAISPGTVKVHLHNAFEKLGVGSRRLLSGVQSAAYALSA